MSPTELLSLPPELHLAIIEYLDIPSALSLLKTHRHFAELLQDTDTLCRLVAGAHSPKIIFQIMHFDRGDVLTRLFSHGFRVSEEVPDKFYFFQLLCQTITQDEYQKLCDGISEGFYFPEMIHDAVVKCRPSMMCALLTHFPNALEKQTTVFLRVLTRVSDLTLPFLERFVLVPAVELPLWLKTLGLLLDKTGQRLCNSLFMFQDPDSWSPMPGLPPSDQWNLWEGKRRWRCEVSFVAFIRFMVEREGPGVVNRVERYIRYRREMGRITTS